MGIFNEHSTSPTTGSAIGRRGPAGVGFVLTQDGDYDIQNKKWLMSKMVMMIMMLW